MCLMSGPEMHMEALGLAECKIRPVGMVYHHHLLRVNMGSHHQRGHTSILDHSPMGTRSFGPLLNINSSMVVHHLRYIPRIVEQHLCSHSIVYQYLRRYTMVILQHLL